MTKRWWVCFVENSLRWVEGDVGFWGCGGGLLGLGVGLHGFVSGCGLEGLVALGFAGVFFGVGVAGPVIVALGLGFLLEVAEVAEEF